MTTLQDEKYRGLRTLVATGTVSDMETAYVASIGAAITSSTPQDAWMEFWDEELVPIGVYNDRAFVWLTGLGHVTGALNDRWKAYWTAVV